jgi:hypothetical protein
VFTGKVPHILYRAILSGKSEGKRPLGRHWHRWKDKVKMNLKEIGWEDLDWVHLTQDKDQWRGLMNTVMNLRVPLNVGNFLNS